MDAASAASASPSVKTRRKSSGPPAPPEAMTGIWVARETARVRSQAKPCCTPSVSMEVSRISPAPSCAARVGNRANAPAYCQRDENFARRAKHHVRHDGALVAGGGDIEEHHFVGALLVIAVGELNRIARIAQVDEVDALHHAAAGDVETGDDPLGQHRSKLQKIAHDLETYGSGFLRMELHAENVAVFEHSCVGDRVGASRRCGLVL